MLHPFRYLSSQCRKRLFWLSLMAALVLFVCLRVIDQPLETNAAPNGIVSFELAGSIAAVQVILASWNLLVRQFAAFSLGLDYLFMLTYGVALSLACLWSSSIWKERIRSASDLGVWLAWGAWLAAGFDAVENLALILLLFYQPTQPWPPIARGCAALKFSLILICLLYAASGFVAALVQRLQPRS